MSNYYEINMENFSKEDEERLLSVIEQLRLKKDECNIVLNEIKLEFNRICNLEIKCFDKILKYENEIDEITEILNEYNRNK